MIWHLFAGQVAVIYKKVIPKFIGTFYGNNPPTEAQKRMGDATQL